jgi:hypothetical protein
MPAVRSLPVLGSMIEDTAAPARSEGLPVAGDLLSGDAGLPVLGSLLGGAQAAATDTGQRPVGDGASAPSAGSLPLVDRLPIFHSLPLVGGLS